MRLGESGGNQPTNVAGFRGFTGFCRVLEALKESSQIRGDFPNNLSMPNKTITRLRGFGLGVRGSGFGFGVLRGSGFESSGFVLRVWSIEFAVQS